MKPLLHLTAPHYWMNDPNGLIYYQGYYHIFYQHFPYASKWGTMHWGHAITKDFIHYQHLPIALYPSKSYDRNGCFSGSALEIDGKMYLYYTGVRYGQEDPEYVHIQKGEDDLRACQALVISDDGMHFDNEKNKQCIIKIIKETYRGDYRDTRDPKVWKKADGRVAMVVGSKIPGQDDYVGKVLFYESQDGIHFSYKNSYSDPAVGNMWECPDIFCLENHYFMIFSPVNSDLPPKPNSNARYMEIDFDEDSLTIKGHKDIFYLDHGLDFYAAQTFLSPDKKRYMLAWLRMRKPVAGEDWVGMLTMPRELFYQKGQLYQRPLETVDALFQYPGEIDFKRPFKLQASLQADSYLNLGGFKITITDDRLHLDREAVSIHMSKVCNDVYSPALNHHYEITLYYDHHVFEIFINGGQYVMSQIVYELNDTVEMEKVTGNVYVTAL